MDLILESSCLRHVQLMVTCHIYSSPGLLAATVIAIESSGRAESPTRYPQVRVVDFLARIRQVREAQILSPKPRQTALGRGGCIEVHQFGFSVVQRC